MIMYKCEYCGKEFKKIQGLAGHKGHCLSNPKINREDYYKRQHYAQSKAAEKIKNKPKPNKQTYKLICQKCGNEYELELTEKQYNNGQYSKFCSRSCANSRIRTQEIKDKIKRSLNIFHKNSPEKNREIFEHIKNVQNGILSFNEFKKKHPEHIRKCLICGKEFIPHIQPSGYKLSGAKTCSLECHKILVSNNSKAQRQKELQNGTFKGWQSRNILSYPEKFWRKVLENNNISFIPNHPIKQKDSSYNYFLDFYIEINDRKIDLEIDGKQHKYKDRKESDIQRDEYIRSLGIEVYRISWNNINTEKGSLLMKSKIDEFLKFYNK